MLMALTEKEKYLIHKTALMMMAGTRGLDRNTFRNVIDMIVQSRCRKLTDEDRKEADADMIEELLLAVGVYKNYEEI